MGQVISLEKVQREIDQLDDRIILTGGCFDIIHPGHILFLAAAKKLGGTLLVLLESDQTVSKLKGPNKPIHTQEHRALILSHLTPVDIVVPIPPLNTDTAYGKVVTTISPAVIAVTKGDPYIDIKKSHAEKVGAHIVEVMERDSEHATSKIASQLNV